MTTNTAWAAYQLVPTPAPFTGAGAATSSTDRRNCSLQVGGQLTWRTSRRLHARFRRAVDAGGRELRVDLRRVSEVDPAGIAVLLVYARLLPTLGGTLELCSVSPACRALMHEMQLPHLLTPVPVHGDSAGQSSLARQQSPDRWAATA